MLRMVERRQDLPLLREAAHATSVRPRPARQQLERDALLESAVGALGEDTPCPCRRGRSRAAGATRRCGGRRCRARSSRIRSRSSSPRQRRCSACHERAACQRRGSNAAAPARRRVPAIARRSARSAGSAAVTRSRNSRPRFAFGGRALARTARRAAPAGRSGVVLIPAPSAATRGRASSRAVPYAASCRAPARFPPR